MDATIKKAPVISNAMMAMIIFIFTEIMIFASFISSFSIIKTSFINWPPMGQPRLPIQVTAINSVFLVLSGVFIHLSFTSYKKDFKKKAANRYFLMGLSLGILFVVIQGFEWLRLISYGLTMTSSLYGSFFYLIIGTHALHVVIASGVLMAAYRRLKRETLSVDFFSASRAFWFFVVGLWPVLYWTVYL